MSYTMLFGVLRMPYVMAMGTELARTQYWDRAQQAVDEIQKLSDQVNDWHVANSAGGWIDNLRCDAERLLAENQRFRAALHSISLSSQNSMSDKSECGKLARKALHG